MEAVARLRARGMNPDTPDIRGTAQNPDVYFQNREAANRFYDAFPDIVEKYMQKVGDLTGRRYGLFDYVGAPDAEKVIIAMGSACDTIAETVSYLNRTAGTKLGVVKVRLYRPFRADRLLGAIPPTAKIIAVLDRMAPGGGGPEVVAQWRGHCDHDILAWKAAAIARWYADALLVVESNSLDATLSGSSQYILETLNEYYSNLYSRKVRDTSRPDSWVDRVGFHTNRETKALIITTLIAMVRDCGYTERDPAALNEMAAFRQLPNGNYGARRGNHDDILMTRAMALYVASTLPPATPLLY